MSRHAAGHSGSSTVFAVGVRSRVSSAGTGIRMPLSTSISTGPWVCMVEGIVVSLGPI